MSPTASASLIAIASGSRLAAIENSSRAFITEDLASRLIGRRPAFEQTTCGARNQIAEAVVALASFELLPHVVEDHDPVRHRQLFKLTFFRRGFHFRAPIRRESSSPRITNPWRGSAPKFFTNSSRQTASLRSGIGLAIIAPRGTFSSVFGC